MTADGNQKINNFFKKEDTSWQTRLATSSSSGEDNDPSKKRKSSCIISPPQVRPKVSMPLGFFDNKLLPTLNAVNVELDRLRMFEEQCNPEDTNAAYKSLCANSIFRSITLQKHFSKTQFLKCLTLRFPEAAKDNIIVSKDRCKWACVICDPDDFHSWRNPGNVIKHYLSEKHRARITSTAAVSDAVQAAAKQHVQEKVFRDEIAQALIDDAIVSSCRKSLPFTAIPLMLDHTARCLSVVAGPNLAKIDMNQVKDPNALGIILRVKALTKQQRIHKKKTRMVVRRGRTALTKRIGVLASMAISKKVDFLRSCETLSLSCDETDAWSLTAPLAVALQGCNTKFEWGNFFVGQTCVALTKTGAGIYDATKSVVDKADAIAGETDNGLWNRCFFLCTDGASNMRSSPMYAGLDSKADGDSFTAQFRQNGKPLMPNLHCICHNLNLALKEAVSELSWCDLWMRHLRAMYNWFSKSPARKQKFKVLGEEMELLQRVVTWKMVYPKYYCPTRWVGIITALSSITKASALHKEYCRGLVTTGFLPDRGDGVDTPPVDEAREARTDAVDEVHTRYHEDTFHKWGDGSLPWDLHIDRIDGDVEILDDDGRVDLDDGDMATLFKGLQDSVGTKKSKLLNEKIGVTDLNLGLDHMMLDVLQPYKILVERLQTQTGPVAHMVMNWINEMFDNINDRFLGPSPTFGEHFIQWSRDEGLNEDMVAQIKSMGRAFLSKFLHRVRFRLQPYWKLIMGAALANPVSSARVAPGAWDGAKDLMYRAGWDAERIRQTVLELKRQRRSANRWPMAQITAVCKNLLRFYKERLDDVTNSIPLFPNANAFARLVFCLHVASAIIETFFSKTKYIKSKTRSSMKDENVANVLHLSQTPAPVDPEVLSNNPVCIDVTAASSRVENDLISLREKYYNRRVMCVFQVNDEDINVHGVVDRVFWCHELKTILFHVTYVDSDSEELELWQIRTFII